MKTLFLFLLFSQTLSAQIPAPTNLIATQVSDTSALLTWNAATGRRISFQLERALGDTSFALIATTGNTSYTNNNLVTGLTYRFRVRSKNRNALSDYSNIATITLGGGPPLGNVTLTLALAASTIQQGQTLTGVVTITNATSSAVSINPGVLASRPPGGTNSGGPYDDFAPQPLITVAAMASAQFTSSRPFTTSDPTGTWYAYPTYRDSNGVWHDGTNTNFTITPATTPPPPGGALYVSTSGNDANPGTQALPWRTMNKVQSVLSSLKPGDSVLFQRGGLWNEELNISNLNGASGSPITFGNYGVGELPIIDGGGRSSGRQWCIGGQSSRMSYLTIDGFECRNTSAYGIAFVSVGAGSAGIIVSNSYIHDTGNGDTGYHNQLMFHDPNAGYNGTQFLNNIVGNCYGHNCIQIHGDRAAPVIRGNECYGWSHNCIDVKLVQGAIVDLNVVHDGLGVQQYSEAYYIEQAQFSWTADVTWTRNVAYGGGFTMAFQCQNAGGPVSCKVYNNTTQTTASGVYGGADSGGSTGVSIDVKNNIFDSPSPRNGGGYVAWDYNDNVRSAPIGPHDLNVNPLFINSNGHNYHLQPNSPVIGKGSTGNDMGAFQH